MKAYPVIYETENSGNITWIVFADAPPTEDEIIADINSWTTDNHFDPDCEAIQIDEGQALPEPYASAVELLDALTMAEGIIHNITERVPALLPHLDMIRAALAKAKGTKT